MNTPKLPPLPEPSWPFGCRYNEKDMQAYAIAAIEAQGVPDGWQLVPKEPTEALLRPFYECPTEELPLAWQAMHMVASAMHRKQGASAPPAPQADRSGCTAGTDEECKHRHCATHCPKQAQQAKPQPLSDKEADRMTERFYLNGRPVPALYRLSLVRATERHYGIKE